LAYIQPNEMPIRTEWEAEGSVPSYPTVVNYNMEGRRSTNATKSPPNSMTSGSS